MYRLLRPLLFRLDPETAHRLVFALLQNWQRLLERRAVAPVPSGCSAFGLDFPNPLGLAAGLDKNAELPHVWAALGFGFAELGTVTARAQPGNPRPRLFRLPADRALINRMGFNNEGAAAVSRRLARRLALSRPPIPLGINIGKSKVAAIEDATADYLTSFRAFFPLADYVVVNVSSPNTPGLRELQSEGQLEPLLGAIQNENQRLASAGRGPRPLLVKIAPDLPDEQLPAIVRAAERCRLAGIIATNTTTRRTGLTTPAPLASEAGGLSGVPLRPLATDTIRKLHELLRGRLPIVGVGGVFTPEDVREKIEAGASLVQIYTSFVYEGPGVVRSLAAAASAALDAVAAPLPNAAGA